MYCWESLSSRRPGTTSEREEACVNRRDARLTGEQQRAVTRRLAARIQQEIRAIVGGQGTCLVRHLVLATRHVLQSLYSLFQGRVG